LSLVGTIPGVTIGPTPGPHWGKTVVLLYRESKAVTVVVGIQVVVTAPSLLVRSVVPSVEIANQDHTRPSAPVHREIPLGKVRDTFGRAEEFNVVVIGEAIGVEVIGPGVDGIVSLVEDVPLMGELLAVLED